VNAKKGYTMSMPSFYNTEECGELFAEKIPTKLLQKFDNDSFEMFISDISKTALRNIALLLQTAKVTITVYDSEYTTLYRINSYAYSNGSKVIEFTDRDYADCGRIETEAHYSGKVQTTFIPVSIPEAMPLFKEIVLQLLSA